jgi:hypothetical protein
MMALLHHQGDIIEKLVNKIAKLERLVKQRMGIEVSAADEPLDSVGTSNVITVMQAEPVEQTGMFSSQNGAFFANPLAASVIDNSAFEFQEFSDQ